MTEAQNLLGLETQRKRDVWACIYVEGANIYVVFVASLRQVPCNGLCAHEAWVSCSQQ